MIYIIFYLLHFSLCSMIVFFASLIFQDFGKDLKRVFKFLKNYPWFIKLQNQDLLIFALKLYIANILTKIVLFPFN